MWRSKKKILKQKFQKIILLIFDFDVYFVMKHRFYLQNKTAENHKSKIHMK